MLRRDAAGDTAHLSGVNEACSARPELSQRLPWPSNVWMGTTVENADYVHRIHTIAQIPAAVRFLSLEPLLGPVPSLPLKGIHWVIVGGESGPAARPIAPSWILQIRNQCVDHNVPFFFKQWGGVNKSLAGRKLDGRLWSEMPSLEGRIMARNRWPELCRSVSEEDGLPTREVGYWSKKKLFFWNRYIEITTSAMVGSPKWPAGLAYVDLFAGPGVCTIKESRTRLPGSPLIAASAPKPFERIILCEKDSALADACEARVRKTSSGAKCTVFRGDCNERVHDIAALIPDRALTLAFIDPTGLDAKFETIATLSRRGQVDLLILFADSYDIVRNVDLYRDQSDSKLDQVLGPDSGWRSMWDQLDNRCPANIKREFKEIYKTQLGRHLGYKKFGEETVKNGSVPLYTLIYASKHERGLDFWDKIATKDPSGQLGLGF